MRSKLCRKEERFSLMSTKQNLRTKLPLHFLIRVSEFCRKTCSIFSSPFSRPKPEERESDLDYRLSTALLSGMVDVFPSPRNPAKEQPSRLRFHRSQPGPNSPTHKQEH